MYQGSGEIPTTWIGFAGFDWRGNAASPDVGRSTGQGYVARIHEAVWASMLGLQYLRKSTTNTRRINTNLRKHSSSLPGPSVMSYLVSLVKLIPLLAVALRTIVSYAPIMLLY